VPVVEARLDQHFIAWRTPPARLDALWAEGWRHFGPVFFRYSHFYMPDGEVMTVQPLRRPLAGLAFTKNQRRVLRKVQDLEVRIQSAAGVLHEPTRQALFTRHKERFTHNVPDDLSDFLGPAPDQMPCQTLEVSLYSADDRLLAASYLDVGATSVSSVYAYFEPSESHRSLGIATMLIEMEYARSQGFTHYYPGYAYYEPSHYDYKKQFSGLEYYRWQVGWENLI
jgi:leucyl-tRNA---protein transferase